MNRVKLGAAGLAIALTALVVPATVRAEQPLIVEAELDRPTIYVSYADLNLRHKAGVERLSDRVARAADQLCLETGVQPVSRVVAGRACRDKAVAGANEQIRAAVAGFGSGQYAALTRIAVTLR
ncbi:MAG TPA: UrcA family protein [Allosphingosinicella sp.]|nr:UrcA family protein [Allosphingosinicella sp.]